jgi:hypothetical protein
MKIGIKLSIFNDKWMNKTHNFSRKLQEWRKIIKKSNMIYRNKSTKESKK